MLRMYKFVVDYDGTCVWSGANRSLEFKVMDFKIGDYTMEGNVYRRVRMPWNINKLAGSREYRKSNLALSVDLYLSSEADMRLLEAWTLLYPSLWQPTKGFDYISYYNGATNTIKNGVVERPQNSATTMFTADGQHWYFGSLTGTFTSMDAYMSQNGVGGTYVWEYSTGDDTWSTLTVTNGTWTGTNVISWTAPGDWIAATSTVIDNSDPLYLVRCRCTVTPSTQPRARFVKRHRPISGFLMYSEDDGLSWEFWNRQYASDAYYPNGWCIRSFTRKLTKGSPNLYTGTLNLLEANY